MRLLSAQCALLLAALCAASPTASKYVLHERRGAFEPVSAALQARSRLDASHVLPMRIGLTQRDIDVGYDMLMDVAHPESPNYGKHWSAAEVNKAFAPTAETVQAVRNWLISAGIEAHRITVSDNKGWLAFDASVEEAEKLFGAQYFQHEHGDEDKYTVGCESYYLPEHITEHVDYITPGVKHQLYRKEQLEPGKRLAKRSMHPPIEAPDQTPEQWAGAAGVDIDLKTIPINCSNYVINGDCIRSLYGLPAIDVTKKVSPVNALGVFEQQAQEFSPSDLDLFFAELAPFIPNGTLPTITSVDGGVAITDPAGSGGEAMLDITMAYALIYPQIINYIEVDDLNYNDNYYYKGFGDTLLDALDGSFCTYSAFGQKGDNNTVDPVYPDPHVGGYTGALECGLYTPPKVISFSYQPAESAWPVNYIRRQCNEWMKLALQGTTAVFASGDNGVEGQITAAYRDRTCLGANATIFAPGYPGTCPYVLSVGATEIRVNVSGLSANPEQAVDYGSYTSGAGFSNIFERPSYQDQVVTNYFSSVNNTLPYYETKNGLDIGKNGGLYNRKGRAIPDVSANGAWWFTYVDGRKSRIGGTSMSTPLFASVVNLLNEARLKAGKTTVGFLHPTLYAHPEAFHDIVDGFNNGCGLDVAFETAPGWDPVTGLGTPKFEKLVEIFLSLP